jgi:Core-2/I-Branching enzyme
MKIAFLVLNHRRPAQLVRLLTALRSQLPDSPIVVHHDVFHGELPAEIFEPTRNVHLLTSRKRIAWGDFSVVDIYCWSLAWMIEHIEFDWVVLLSAQDYPIKPLVGLADDLIRNNADAVLRAIPISHLPKAAARRDMNRRYFYRYSSAPRSRRSSWLPDTLRRGVRHSTGLLIDTINILQPFFKIYRFPDLMPYRFGWRARNVPFTRSRPCWYGSMWFGLSRYATEYVLNYMSDHPEYVDYYRGTIIPDESMIATLICNSPNLRVDNRDLHYTRWSNSKSGHPDIFQFDDLAELAAAPQYFARKFDIGRDPSILDRLDEYIGNAVSNEVTSFDLL